MQPMILKCNMDQNQIIFRAVPFLVLCFLAVSDSNNANAWMIDECRMQRRRASAPASKSSLFCPACKPTQ